MFSMPPSQKEAGFYGLVVYKNRMLLGFEFGLLPSLLFLLCVRDFLFWCRVFNTIFFQRGQLLCDPPSEAAPRGWYMPWQRQVSESRYFIYIIYQWNWGGDGMEVISFILWLNISGPSACHPTARQLQSKKGILVCHWTFLGVMFLSTHTRQQAELSILSFLPKMPRIVIPWRGYMPFDEKIKPL